MPATRTPNKFERAVSLARNLRKSLKPRPWGLEKPTIIQFPVNDICNSRCQMCNIWQRPLDAQITPEQLIRVLRSSLFSEVQGVGINGGEPTLRPDLAQLVDILFQHLPKLRTISLITNAFNSKQVIERIQQLGEVAKKNGGLLDVMVSLDGYDEVHDRVRGRKGNFINAIQVIQFIKHYNLVYNYRLGCTVIKENVFGLEDLLEFAIGNDIYIKYRLGIPHQRLYSQDTLAPFTLTRQEQYHLIIFLENLIRHYEKSELQKFFYRSLIGQLAYGRPRIAGCDWQHRGATLTARGELLYCAVKSPTLGSAIEQDAAELYFGSENVVKDVIANHCDSCSHDYIGLPPAKQLFHHWRKRLLHNVEQRLPEKLVPRLLEPLRESRQQMQFQRRLQKYALDLSANLRPALPTVEAVRVVNKILICGWYGTETLGDKAILGGVIKALISALGVCRFTIVSLEPYITQMTVLQMPELAGCDVLSVDDGLQRASQVDLVVFGGGPIMAISELAEMLAIFCKAAQHCIPTLIAGCGVGPLGSSLHNRTIAELLRLSSFRIYRDTRSLEIAASLGTDVSKDIVTEDPAFTWLSKTRFNSTLSSETTLLLGLRDWPYSQYAPGLYKVAAENTKRRFEQAIVQTLEQLLIELPELRLLPFPMSTNPAGDDDRWFYRRLFRHSAAIKVATNECCLGAELSPEEARQIFQSATAAITMRFHALVFALAYKLPVVAIDYTLGNGKVNSLARRFDVPSISLDQVDSTLLVSQVKKLLRQSPQRRTTVSKLDFTGAIASFAKRFALSADSQQG